MENQNNSTNNIKRERNLSYAIIAVCSAVILALAITVGVSLGAVNSTTAEMEKPSISVDAESEKFYLPVENGSVIRPASLNKLVYMPSLNMWKTHNGVDFSASANTPVVATYGGSVKSVEQTTLEGVVVTVEHSNGLTSVYKSLSSASVKAGDKVSGGDKIGVVGTMISEDSDGIHLHLEMLKDGKLVDPLIYIEVSTEK